MLKKKNIWKVLYKNSFNEELDSSLGINKSQTTFTSRIKKQHILNFKFNDSPKNFGTSPHGRQIKEYEIITNYMLSAYNFTEELKNFANKNKSFKQFINNRYPKVFKSIHFKSNNNNSIYDFYISNYEKIIKIDFYCKKGHFEFWIVKKLDGVRDLYVNKELSCKNIFPNYVDEKIFNKELLNKTCKKMDVKKFELIKFLLMF